MSEMQAHGVRTVRSKMQRTARLAGVLIGSAVLLGAMTTSASASEPPEGPGFDHRWTTNDPAHGGTVYVTEHGDVVKVCDTAADGWAPLAVVGVEPDFFELYSVTATGGYGHCASVDASKNGGIYNLPEGKKIEVDVMLDGYGLHETDNFFLNDH